MRRLAALVLACLLLASCGGSTASPSATAEPSTGLIGPVILDANTTTATVPVGRMVVFNVADPVTWEIGATPDGVVKVQKGSTDGSATFNPGAMAIAAGTATVTLTNPSGEKLVYTITVE